MSVLSKPFFKIILLLFYFSRHTVVNEEDIENTENSQKRLIYTHKIKIGTCTVRNYGLALAAKTHLPEDTVKLAYELSELIVRNETVNIYIP